MHTNKELSNQAKSRYHGKKTKMGFIQFNQVRELMTYFTTMIQSVIFY